MWGIDIRDSKDAQVLNNILSNNNGIGVRATDSGRSDRVDLDNILVQGNNLGGDRIINCGGLPVRISVTTGSRLERWLPEEGWNGCSGYRARLCATRRRRCCCDRDFGGAAIEGLVGSLIRLQ